MLQVNPFRDRICQVFSSTKDGNMTFEDFLDMMSVFSDNAPKNVKVEYAFRIYGNFLGINGQSHKMSLVMFSMKSYKYQMKCLFGLRT